MCQTVTDIYGVKFNFEENLDFDKKSKIPGKLNFKPLEISISKELEIINLLRWRFTLAHEIGHLIFHYGILKNFLDENTDTEKSISFDDDIPGELNKNMEAQANIFASLILLPLEPLTEEVERYFVKEHITEAGTIFIRVSFVSFSIKSRRGKISGVKLVVIRAVVLTTLSVFAQSSGKCGACWLSPARLGCLI